MITGLFGFAPALKALYPGWYMVGHVAASATMMGAL